MDTTNRKLLQRKTNTMISEMSENDEMLYPTCRPAFDDRVVRTLVSAEVFDFPPFPPVVLDDIVFDIGIY